MSLFVIEAIHSELEAESSVHEHDNLLILTSNRCLNGALHEATNASGESTYQRVEVVADFVLVSVKIVNENFSCS